MRTTALPPELAATRVTTGALWRPPTRRAFVAMLGLGAAAAGLGGVALRLGDPGRALDPPRQTWHGATRWIGHC